MCTNSICRSTHHARKCRLVLSGPLSQRIVFGRPRSPTIPSSTRVTLRLSKLVSTSSTLACTHPPRSVLESLVRTPLHRAQNPAPIPGSPPSASSGCPRARNVSASSAGSSPLPPDKPDALACGSHALPSGPTKHAVAIREARLLPRQLRQPRSQRLIAAPALVAIARYRHRHQSARAAG